MQAQLLQLLTHFEPGYTQQTRSFGLVTLSQAKRL